MQALLTRLLTTLDLLLIPLAGVRTTEQAIENTVTFGPLPADIAEQITTLLADSPERS